MEPFSILVDTLKRLRDAHIYYELSNNRDEAISVNVAVPGQRWELDFMLDGSVDVEVFRSDGTIYSDKSITELIEQFSEQGGNGVEGDGKKEHRSSIA